MYDKDSVVYKGVYWQKRNKTYQVLRTGVKKKQHHFAYVTDTRIGAVLLAATYLDPELRYAKSCDLKKWIYSIQNDEAFLKQWLDRCTSSNE